MAMKYAEKLCKESRWSKATYTYQKAAFLMMCDDQTDETRAHIQLLFKWVVFQVSLNVHINMATLLLHVVKHYSGIILIYIRITPKAQGLSLTIAR